jgi:hypothetical protein
MSLLSILEPLVVKYGPELETDIVNALHKSGYTVAQIDGVFAQAKPYDQLGINPNAPVVPESAPPTPPAAT